MSHCSRLDADQSRSEESGRDGKTGKGTRQHMRRPAAQEMSARRPGSQILRPPTSLRRTQDNISVDLIRVRGFVILCNGFSLILVYYYRVLNNQNVPNEKSF